MKKIKSRLCFYINLDFIQFHFISSAKILISQIYLILIEYKILYIKGIRFFFLQMSPLLLYKSFFYNFIINLSKNSFHRYTYKILNLLNYFFLYFYSAPMSGRFVLVFIYILFEVTINNISGKDNLK